MLKNISKMIRLIKNEKTIIICIGFLLMSIGTCCCSKSEENIKTDIKRSYINIFGGTCIGDDTEMIDDLTNSEYYLKVVEDALKNKDIQKCEEAYYNFCDTFKRKLRGFPFLTANDHIAYGGMHDKEAHKAVEKLNGTFLRHASSVEEYLRTNGIKLKKSVFGVYN